MKSYSVVAVTLTLLFASQSQAAQLRHTQSMESSGHQIEQRATSARSDQAEQQEYLAELKAYNAHQWKVPHGQEASLYGEYKNLLARYTKVLMSSHYAGGRKNAEPLHPVAPAGNVVTVNTMKADYGTMANDYLAVVDGRTVKDPDELPPELPPLPPIPLTDVDASRLQKLEATLRGAANVAIARGQPHVQYWSDVPLGGLHNHPGQPAQQSGGWCQVDSGGDLVPCN